MKPAATAPAGRQRPAARRRLILLAALALAATGSGIAALQLGLPRWQAWRSQRFLLASQHASIAGDQRTAELAARSALQLAPADPAARAQLAALLLQQGAFTAAEQALGDLPAAAWGGDPAQTLHDLLLLRRDFAGLRAYCLHRLVADPARRELWLHSALRATRLAPPATSDPALPGTAGPLLVAQAALAHGDPAAATAALAALGRGSLTSAEALLLVDLWLQAGRPDAAALALNRVRHRLSAFDEALADYTLEAAHASPLASPTLLTALRLADSASRRDRLLAAVVQHGRAAHAQTLERALRAAPARLLVEDATGAWLLTHAFGLPAAAIEHWSARVRDLAGRTPPALVGAQLAHPGPDARRAAELLVGQLPASRDLLFALLARSGGAPSPASSPELPLHLSSL